MRTALLTITATALLCAPVWAQDTYVEGYYRNDGTYVEPHYRSQSDNNIHNNYSTRENISPYTNDYHGRAIPPSIGNGNENDSEPMEYRGRPSSYRPVR